MNNKVTNILIVAIFVSCVMANIGIDLSIIHGKDLSNQIESMTPCAMQPVSANNYYISDSMVVIDSDGMNIGDTYNTVSSSKAPDVYEESQPIIETSYNDILTDEEIKLIASIVIGEAEGEGELGQRLVADTILNRVDSDRFPNTVHEVTHQPGQYDCLWNGRLNRCSPTDDTFELVREEAVNRTNNEVIFFRTKHYGYGKPLLQEGHHYFCGLDI